MEKIYMKTIFSYIFNRYSEGGHKTLELNGHVASFEIDYSGTTALITNKGTLTIQDSTDINKDGTGKGGITYNALNPDTEWYPDNPSYPYPRYANNTITNMGTLVIESGLIENTTSGGASYAVDNNSTERDVSLLVKGGKVVGRVNFAIRMYANSTTNNNIANVTGGVIEGIRAIWLQLPGSSGQEN